MGKNYNDLSITMLGATRVSRGFPSDPKMGKDIRIYNMRGILEGVAVKARETHAAAMKKLMFSNAVLTLPEKAVQQAMNFFVYAFVCLNALRGVFDIGGIVKYVGLITRLVDSINGLMSSVALLQTNLPFLDHYLAFFEIDNAMYQGTLPVEKRRDHAYELAFHDVSFKYPGSEAYALKNLNLRLNVGSRLAVVGMNGSGKTTMIKLLCRLYDPTEGVITLNGIDIRKYDYEEYLRLFSVVFQDFKLFSFALGQNVAAQVAYDAAEAARSLEMAGFGARLSAMPNGLDTPLYKDFEEDGVDISGGEAQKIALARALYKNAPFIILDEPTAALDPIAEFEIYVKFNEIVGPKTAIYISHRLSSCRFCDDIAVFHEGELIERGSHDTLLADKNGKYYELWNAQARYYNDKADTVIS